MYKKQIILFFLWFTILQNIVAQKSILPPIDFQKKAISEGYSFDDISNLIITDEYISRGTKHLYLTQSIDGIPVYHTSSSIHIHGGNIHISPIHFQHNINRIAINREVFFDKKASLLSIAKKKNYKNQGITNILQSNIDNHRIHTIIDVSNSPILIKEIYFPIDKNNLHLAWEVIIDEVKSGNWTTYIVDATNGNILEEINLTVQCDEHIDTCSHDPSKLIFPKRNPNTIQINNSYHVIALPFNDPYETGRTFEIAPWDNNVSASPNGWHNVNGNTYTTTHGNNVDAYEDSNHSNSPTGGNAARANGGTGLDFDFTWTSSGSPANYKPAAITNLFYWNNIIHDVLYNYGFDEASGNFQKENYSANGSAIDDVRAEAQDGNGTCNANFGTPPDGSRPRMQMYLCGNKDSDFDNGVIIHEYGHGVSNRLTGGPSMASCLNNAEQMGEGWSDYIAILMTMLPGDQATDAVAIGNWFFGTSPTGGGIRPFPYSTNMAINPMTYESISTVSIPHGVGSVWATMLWDFTWAMIDVYGWDADLYNGNGGNNKALALVLEGMKLQVCSPGFVDGRDAILAADELLNGEANKALIWDVFAHRGLGYSAVQGSSYIVGDEVEAFDLPPDHSIQITKTVDKHDIVKGDTLTFYIDIYNPSNVTVTGITLLDPVIDSINFIAGTLGAFLENDTVKWPIFDLSAGASIQYEFTAWIDTLIQASKADFIDDIELANTNWSPTSYASTSWNIQTNNAHSGTKSWFANDGSSPGIANLDLSIPLGLTTQSELKFYHYYNTEASWDGGLVMISIDNGHSWIDLEPYFTKNGYNDIIYFFKPGYSGNSGGFIESIVDLSEFSGQNAILRFQMNCDQAVGGNGWFIDDISISNTAKYISNTVYLTDGTIHASHRLEYPIHINAELNTYFSIDNNCDQSQTTSATAIITNTNGPFTYNWSNGSSAETTIITSPGTYYVTISDDYTSSIDSVHIISLPAMVNTTKDLQSHSLRSVIMNTCPNDTIFFASSLLNDTITLTKEIIIDKNLVIGGLGKDHSTIDVNHLDRAFWILPNVECSIEDLLIKSSQKSPNGGAIFNEGFLLLDDINLFQNREGQKNISISNSGTIILKDSVTIK